VIRARKSDLTFFKFDPVQGNPSQIYQIKDDRPQLYNWSLSPDGTTLAIARGKWGDQEDRIHLVSLNGGPERWLSVSGWPGVASLDWAADSKSIWVATAGDRNALLNVNLQGTVRVAWRPQRLGVEWAIPSRDGKSLALHVNSTSANVWMLERQ
jgi:dipeptidyl aminopeptidase/acylaminoacyl peptidase